MLWLGREGVGEFEKVSDYPLSLLKPSADPLRR